MYCCCCGVADEAAAFRRPRMTLNSAGFELRISSACWISASSESVQNAPGDHKVAARSNTPIRFLIVTVQLNDGVPDRPALRADPRRARPLPVLLPGRR